jgi:hypothetical protein
MAAVVAAVVRSGRAFSGSTAVSVVDDVGGGCDGVPQPFGCRAVMIAHARAPDCFSSVGPAGQRQTVSPAVNARGVCGSQERGSPRSINCRRGRGESLTSLLSFHVLASCLLPGRAFPQSRPCLPSSRAAAFPASGFRPQWLCLSQS